MPYVSVSLQELKGGKAYSKVRGLCSPCAFFLFLALTSLVVLGIG